MSSFSLFPVAMRTALSAMMTNQTALSVTSNNIANANTDGYTKKTANIASQAIDGVGAGVQVESVTRTVNEFLQRNLRTQMSQLGSDTISDQYYSNMQNLFGTPDSSNSLAMQITELGNNLQSLSLNPQDPAAQQQVVLSAQTVASTLNTSAQQVQSLREQANQNISDLVGSVNQALDKIATLNQQIALAGATNQPTGELEDQRDQAVNTVADAMDVSYFTRPDGELVLYTGSGQTLVDNGTSFHLDYTPASAMSETVSYPSGGISPISVDGTDITDSIKSGRLKALVDMRDTTLPNLASQFDAVAQALATQMNAVHNQGTAMPPPNSLQGTAAVGASTAVSFTGTARIAVVDSSGKAVGLPLDLNFADLATDVGGTPTLTQIRDAINGVYSGATQPIAGLAGATASIDASGHLVITATSSSNGIAINEMDSAESATGEGFSQFFGLNDLFVGSASSGGMASSIAVRSDIVTNPANLASGTLPSGTIASGNTVLSVGDNTNVNRLADQLTSSVSFAATGGLPALNTTLDGYAAQILSSNSQAASSATAQLGFQQATFTTIKNQSDSDSGVNIDEELSNLMLYQNSYAASARLITTISDTLQELLGIVK
jgi:flagellar hook-associated protein 1 FlgK